MTDILTIIGLGILVVISIVALLLFINEMFGGE